MEKEKKISKGIVIGCLMMVVALTIWVININDTYSIDTTKSCKTINGIAYKYVSNATNDQYGCCPVSDTAKIGSLGGGNKCFSNTTVNGSCPAGYTLMKDSSGNCIADLGEVVDSVCYFCSGVANYVWSSSMPSSSSCVGGTWQVVSKTQSECKNPTASCYFCNGDPGTGNNYYRWSTVKPTATCSGGTWQTVTKTQSECVDPTASCYYCTGDPGTGNNYYRWSTVKPTATCSGGTWSTVTKSKSECVDPTESCYYCTGDSGSGTKYRWAANTPTAQCNGGIWQKLSNITSSSSCKASTSGGDSSTDDPKVYKVTFNPDGGTWSDGTTAKKVKEYTSKKYFSEPDLAISKTGYTFKGWKSSITGGILKSYVDSTDDNSTLTAVWISNDTSSGGTTDPGNDDTCEYISKSSCEVAYHNEYDCVKDSNNCYVKGSLKQSGDDDNQTCTYYTKTSCENAYSGYNCTKDSNGCYVRGSKKNNSSSGSGDSSGSQDPSSNPNTGSVLLYLSILIGVATLGYSVYYASKIKSKEEN